MGILLGIAAFHTSSCTNRVPDEDTAPEEITLTPEEIEARSREDVRRRFNAQLKRLQEAARNNPDNFDAKLDNLRTLRSGFAGTPHEKAVDDLLAAEQQALLETAAAKLAEAMTEVDGLIDVGDFAGAEERLDELLAEVFRGGMRSFEKTPSFEELEKKKERIAHLSDAENEAHEALRRAEGYTQLYEYAKAVGTLDAYPDMYKDTKYYNEIVAKLETYYGHYTDEKKEKAKTEQIPWKDQPIDKYLSDWYAHAAEEAVWSVEEGVLEANNTTDQNAFLIAAGGDNWVEFMVQFEVKSPQKEISMGLRRHYARSENFMRVGIELETDEWVRLLVTIQEGNLKVVNQDTFEDLLERRMNYEYPKGGFAFLLEPKAHLTLRNVQYRVLSEEKEEKAADKQESDDG